MLKTENNLRTADKKKAKSEGNKTLLMIGVLAIGGYLFFFKKKANSPEGSHQYYDNQFGRT